MLKRLVILIALLAVLAAPAAAENRVIVRTSDWLNGNWVIRTACKLLGCNVVGSLDGTLGKLFLVTTSDLINLNSFLKSLLSLPGIVAAEVDQTVRTMGDTAQQVPDALYDTTPVDYYGTTVRRGYVTQPAVRIIALEDARYAYGVKGAGVVAVIDTGVDPNHPALQRVLLTGYDFTRNRTGADETGDIDQSTAAMVDQSTAAMVDGNGAFYVNQSTAAMVDQSTAAMVDNPKYAAFGHGTMVAGVVHLVAPEAKILPLKAFKADGSGYSSDILRAIYYAAQNGADVVNMSFSYTTSSPELARACEYAIKKGLVMVASAGNDGKKITVYPAALDLVMGVASTTNDDTRSSFSNYGSVTVWVAAPGEGIVTTYPFGTYAATWGTSFSAPFVSGASSLLVGVKNLNGVQAENSVANAKWISYDLGNGRLDVFLAVQAWRQKLGIR